MRHVVAALPVVLGGDPAVLVALVRRLLVEAARGPAVCLLAGMHESDPAGYALRRLGGWKHVNRLYAVCWSDGEDEVARLDGRVPYLELGSL